MRLLQQYRTTIQIFIANESDTWQDIFQKVVCAGIKTGTIRAAKGQCHELSKEFEESNRLDECKTGDPGNFTEKEKLLCDTMEFVQQRDMRGRCKSDKKSGEQEEKARKDKKANVVATFSQKKQAASEMTKSNANAGDGK